jgi:transcriptional regulator with XRE-family HTH domain
MSRQQAVEALAKLHHAARNIDQATLAKWESGETRITVEDFQLLAACYCITPERLFSVPPGIASVAMSEIGRSAHTVQPEEPHPWAHLRAWRNFFDLSLQQVADAFDMYPASIHKWESGKVPITVANLLRLAEFYGVQSIHELTLAPPLKEMVRDRQAALGLVAQLNLERRRQWLDLGRTLAEDIGSHSGSNLNSWLPQKGKI